MSHAGRKRRREIEGVMIRGGDTNHDLSEGTSTENLVDLILLLLVERSRLRQNLLRHRAQHRRCSGLRRELRGESLGRNLLVPLSSGVVAVMSPCRRRGTAHDQARSDIRAALRAVDDFLNRVGGRGS